MSASLSSLLFLILVSFATSANLPLRRTKWVDLDIKNKTELNELLLRRLKEGEVIEGWHPSGIQRVTIRQTRALIGGDTRTQFIVKSAQLTNCYPEPERYDFCEMTEINGVHRPRCPWRFQCHLIAQKHVAKNRNGCKKG